MRRRAFLGSLGGGLLAVVPGRPVARVAPSTEVVPTIFHSHPDGATTLVRFLATIPDVPAGRLRVRDGRSGRLLGTAGMVRRGEQLVGELWLPLTAPLTVYSDLETPARRGIQRTLHHLTPTPRWVIHWLILAAPNAIWARAARLSPLLRATDAAHLVPAGVRVNGWHPLPWEGAHDHLDLLRITVPAVLASRASGVPVGQVALVEGGPPSPRMLSALAGGQVGAVVSAAEVTDPATLGLGGGRAQALRRIEPWLLARQPPNAESFSPIALVIGSDVAQALDARATIDEWNAAYAYPRLTVGDEDAVIRAVTAEHARDAADAIPATDGLSEVGITPADPTAVFLPLATLVAPTEASLDGIARRFSFPVAGTLVFNPSPFGRSGVARYADGAFRVVTDVPALGYAFLPESDGAIPEVAPRSDTIASAHARLSLDQDGGAIFSLRDGATGLELVAPGAVLNGFDHAVVSDLRAETIAGVGRRLIARRMTAAGAITSTITVFDALPWVDIENHLETTSNHRPTPSRFGFAPRFPRLQWEVPGGVEEADVPVSRFAPIRWAAFRGDAGSLLIGMTGISGASVGDDGTLLLEGGAHQLVRLRWHTGYLLPDDPWRFGFGMLPLVAQPTTGAGDASLPTFGRMVDMRDPAVAIVGLKPADDGVGVVVYLMDLGGPARAVQLRPGLLPFAAGVLTDLAERDRRPAETDADGAILVPIAPSGYAAVRLLTDG